ncbi:LysR substrate-binding domain-containing protein [Microbacterium sp. NPDC057650]|uniref:LysR substrate-binding domain-containing protein n=1 Tax=unclassified Microbacterium TaxID=2609290 RepID=UPI00366AF1E3
MSIPELRAFDAVASEGGFTPAARALGVRQPTVSGQVGALERRFGVQLIDRATGEPTQLGRRLKQLTAPMLGLHRAAERLLEGASGAGTRRVRLVVDTPVSVMPLLQAVREVIPEAEFDVGVANGGAAMDQLRAGRADVVVVADAPQGEGFDRTELARQDLAAVVRHDHRLAAGNAVRLADLLAEPLVQREAGSVTRATLERAAREIGVKPRLALTVEGREAAVAAVAAGFGCTVIGEHEFIDDPGVLMLDLLEPSITLIEYLVCLSGQSRTGIVGAMFAAAESRDHTF